MRKIARDVVATVAFVAALPFLALVCAAIDDAMVVKSKLRK